MFDAAKVEEFLRRHYHLIVVLMLVLLLVSLIAAGASNRIGNDTITVGGDIDVTNSTVKVNNSTVYIEITPPVHFDHGSGSRMSFKVGNLK